ncbi:aldehyde ferredoxin oxidoreductase family protein [Thermoproteota archaeon]
MYGYCGRLLQVDLSKGKIRVEDVPKSLIDAYIGGRSINARLLWDYLKPNTSPLGPNNVIIFGAGVLAGTSAPSCGRITITTKSPETNIYLKTSAGGYFSHEMKFAGYDHILIKGISQSPVYLWIEDDTVEIMDASNLWGKDVRETNRLLKEKHGEDVNVACIGQGGENLVKFASIMVNVYSAAGRGGAGAVMGSKNLKAIAIRGTGSVKVKEPEEFSKLVRDVRKALSRDSAAQSLFIYGTSGSLEEINETYALPTYNYKKGYIKNAYSLSGQCLVEAGYLKRRRGCGSCSISCHRYSTIDSGKYSGTYTGGPEYETFCALGSGTGTTDTASVIKANELCNKYGVDTISTGSVIGWAMESYERGVITKKDIGFDLNWGDGTAVVELVRKIAFREGIGNVLAEGVKKASEKFGKDSWKWAIQAKGLEQSRVETRAAKGYALAFAVNPRGPDHLHTEVIAEFGMTPEAKALVKKIAGDEKYASSYLTEKRSELVVWHEDCYAITEILGFCAFTTTWAYAVNPINMAKMYSLATGRKISESELMKYGRKTVTLERCFNIRQGLSRRDDVLPWRLMNEPAPEGPPKGMMNSEKELSAMLDEYYALHDWDLKTGWPTRETLESLDMTDIAKELEKMGKIPPPNSKDS